MSVVNVRPATDRDLPRIARLHIEAFPGSVLGELGEEAVRRNYEWQMTGPHDLTALVGTDDDQELLGFLFAGVFRGSTIGFVKSQRWFLMRQVVRHPGILLRGVGWNRLTLAVRLLARRTPAAGSEEPEAVPRRSIGVLAIAVAPAAQGRGVGGELMSELVRSAVSQGFEAMHLTVHPDNARALAFYRSLGWVEMPEPDGSWVGRMSCSLSRLP